MTSGKGKQLRRSRGTASVVLLASVLILAGAMAYYALAAVTSHRATAEATLQDYAGVAGWEYRRRTEDALRSSLWDAFTPIRNISLADNSGLPGPDVLQRWTESNECGQCPYRIKGVHTYFKLALPEGHLEVVSETLREKDYHRRIIESLDLSVLSDERTMGRYFPLATEDGPTRDLGAYWLVSHRGEPVAVYGMIAALESFHDFFAVYCSRVDLLPPALAGDKPTDSLVQLTVSTADDALVYSSPNVFSDRFASLDTLGSEFADLRILAAIRPSAAGDLVIGGLPQSRLPLVMGLLSLTVLVGIAALRQLRREQEFARIRDDFVSGVSHELRTPLTQIRMFSELLDGGQLRNDGERSRSVKIISREARRLTHLVENILHFSRGRRNNTQLQSSHVSVDRLVHDVLEAFAPMAQARDVRCHTDVEAGLSVVGDRDALGQILLNLLDNALKYGPRAQTISVGATHVTDRVRLWVEDEGPGIPEAERDAVWEPYHRLARDANGSIGGSGIGLAVVSELVGNLKGTVWVEGTRGARFVIELPCSVPLMTTEESDTLELAV